jgi:WD40 repeat protein
MWDLQTARMTRKFTGQRQGSHIIRSCFGGAANNFVVSGSEGKCFFPPLPPLHPDHHMLIRTQFVLDAKVYVWHRDSGVLLEILEGHGPGSVNSVVWHPHEASVFASCSDDRTIRIWEPQSTISSMDSITPSASGETLHIDKGKTRPATSSVLNPITSH